MEGSQKPKFYCSLNICVVEFSKWFIFIRLLPLCVHFYIALHTWLLFLKFDGSIIIFPSYFSLEYENFFHHTSPIVITYHFFVAICMNNAPLLISWNAPYCSKQFYFYLFPPKLLKTTIYCCQSLFYFFLFFCFYYSSDMVASEKWAIILFYLRFNKIKVYLVTFVRWSTPTVQFLIKVWTNKFIENIVSTIPMYITYKS